jgi:uncharacterized protein
MNLLFNLVHISDLNLFKSAINELVKCNKVYVTVRNRGNLLRIAQKEINVPIFIIGKHQQLFHKKLIGIFKSEYAYWKLIKKLDINISINQSFYSIWACKLRGAKFITFEDDYEYKLAFYYAKWFADKDVMPKFIPAKGKNVIKYNGFKELAYLHPTRFSANQSILNQYGLIPYEYVFVREVSNVSLNYKNKKDHLNTILSILYSKNAEVVLSIEDKIKIDLLKESYPELIILDEPVENIFSLIRFAKFSISSGDTVARESALLSTPCIYTGNRNMLMNKSLIDLGMIIEVKEINKISKDIDYLFLNAESKHSKMDAQLIQYDDTTRVIIDMINNFKCEKA